MWFPISILNYLRPTVGTIGAGIITDFSKMYYFLNLLIKIIKFFRVKNACNVEKYFCETSVLLFLNYYLEISIKIIHKIVTYENFGK